LDILKKEDLEIKIPKMIKVKQTFESQRIDDIENEVVKQLKKEEINRKIKANQKIAIAVGSRGVANIGKIVKKTGQYLNSIGTIPFIVPAMGSHGGATAEGQLEVLKSYGITEETMSMEIKSSIQVVEIGRTEKNIPVYMDKIAYEADMVIVINRVKPHTDFRGSIESGICKMMAIGLGKYKGCSRLHQEGLENFTELIPSVAEVFIKNSNVGFGIAIVENAYDETAIIEAIPVERFFEDEPKLLKIAKKKMPKIMLPRIDVLVVEQIGKDITGSGMDTNIIGRTRLGKTPNFDGPDIERIVVLGLSEPTHGNAAGIGLAEFTTREVFEKLDFVSTYRNVIAAGNPDVGRIPLIMANEKEAIVAAIKCCSNIDYDNPKIVRIKDTLHLGEIYISENMIESIKDNDFFEIMQ
jgi:nucleotide-binding universal stress UspA family protein